MSNELMLILKSFDISSELIECAPLGNGHINSTFLVCVDNKKYVLQKINNYVFKDVDLLMNNYYKVTEYLYKNKIETIHLIKANDEKPYLKIGDDYYRLYEYIDNAIWHEEISNLELVYEAAKAFGQFHKTLKGFNAKELGEVIPNFHNTYQRYVNLLNAIKEDKMDRVKDCLPEIKIVNSFEQDYNIITTAINAGLIPLAVTHNDPKINNVLFDKNSGDIRAVIDLDTVMPGSYLYDFGDALRSLFTGDNEDSEDLSKLKVNFDVFETYAKGYLSEMKNVLTKREIELLPFSAFLLTIECGIRFLEDYIRGDVYFRIKKPNHNLIRARTQLTLAKDIYKNLDKLNDIIDKLV
ncbi:MAG: phosphotransferase [Bacilli bacterium]|nr:phosphotransferase [Bacilli bacterium]